MKLTCHGGSVIGQRPSNQDSFSYHVSPDDSGLFAIVADGMGGYNGGDIASRLAVDTMETALLTLLSSEELSFSDWQNRMNVSLAAANQAINQQRQQDPRIARMGTTLTALLVRNNKAMLVHVGDSRCYRLRNRKLHQLTEDHNVAQQLFQEQAISSEELATHPYRHVLTKALGMNQHITASEQELRITPGEMYALCSDGFYQVIEEQDIVAALDSQESLAQSVEQLLELCTQRNTRDNASLVLITVETQ